MFSSIMIYKKEIQNKKNIKYFFTRLFTYRIKKAKFMNKYERQSFKLLGKSENK